MQKMICSVCGYVHDEENAGLFCNLREGWVCPLCKADKSAFKAEGAKSEIAVETQVQLPSADRELSALEMSIVCSNLARGCEKQYLNEESQAFSKLAMYFKSKDVKAKLANPELLLELVNKDLSQIMPQADSYAQKAGDRGAMRSLVWAGKVTAMLKSILERYQSQGESMLENTGVYVCTICGFIYVGSELPNLCPICKVPNYKFEEVRG